MRTLWMLFMLSYLLRESVAEEPLRLSLSPEFEAYECGPQRINAVLSLEAATRLERKAPVSLTSVIDKSGSMTGDKLELILKTNQFLVEQLAGGEEENYLGLVAYSSYVTEPLRLQQVTEDDVESVKKLLSSTKAGGSTNLSGGLMRGLQQQREGPADGPAIKVVFLFTDGVPTLGIMSPVELRKKVQEFLEEEDDNIVVYSFGFGSDLDFDMLVDVAEAGNGVPYIISKEEDIPGAFGDALGGLQSTLAVDLSVILTPLNGTEIVSIQAGGRHQADVEGGIQISLGDMFVEERRDLLIELDIPDGCESVDVLSVQGGFFSTATAKTEATSEEILSIERDEAAPANEEVNPVVETSKMRYTAATAVSDAQGKSKAGDDNEAVSIIVTATAVVEVSPLSESEIIQAILEDLGLIKSILGDQGRTTLERIALMQEVKDALAKQRSGGASTASGAALETDVKKEVSRNATKQVLEGTKFELPPEASAPATIAPVFQYTFDPEFVDITDEATVVSTYLNIVVDDPPAVPQPMAIIFLVDSFVFGSEDRLGIVLEFTKGVLDYLLREKSSDKSALALILTGQSGIPTIDLKSVTQESVSELLTSIEQATFTSEGDFADALESAVELLESDKEPRRKVIMAFMGQKIKPENYSRHAEEVTKLVTTTPVPIGIYPVLTDLESEGIKQANALAEPTGSNVILLERKEDVNTTLEEIRDLIVFVAAQNMSIASKPGSGIEIVDVLGGELNNPGSDDGVVTLGNLHYGDWRQIRFKLNLPPGSGNDTLLSINLDYFDATAHAATSKGPLSLLAFRASEEVFEARKEARKEISDTLGTAKDFLESNATLDASVALANAITAVNVSLADDPIVTDLVNELVALSILLNKTLAGDRGNVEDLSDALGMLGDLEKKAVVPLSDEGIDILNESGLVPKVPDDPLAQSILSVTINPEQVDLTSDAQNVSISMRIETSSATADLVEGAFVVLLDVSDGMSDDDVDLATDMLVEFVRALSRRQGKRSIDVLIFGGEVESLVSVDNVDFSNVDNLVTTIQNRRRKSGFDLGVALTTSIQTANADEEARRSLLQAVSQLPQQTVLVCIIGGNRTFADVEATLAAAEDALTTAENVMTMFPILMGENNEGLELVAALALVADGTPYIIESKSDADEIVEQLGGWFETVAVQDLILTATPLHGAKISVFSGALFFSSASGGQNTVSVPYLFFDEGHDLDIILSIPAAIGNSSLLSISGSFVRARTQHQVTPLLMSAYRTSPVTMKARDRLLDDILEKTGEAGQDLVKNQGAESVVVVSAASAMTDASPAKDDSLVKDIGDQLKGIEEVMEYALQEGNEDKHALQDVADALSDVEAQASRHSKHSPAEKASNASAGIGDEKKGLVLSVLPEFKEYSSDEDTAYANITVIAPDHHEFVNNPAVTLVIDMTSGLSEGLQALVKDTAEKIITSLEATENEALLGVVVYGEAARIAAQIQPLTEASKSDILSIVSSLEAEGDAELLDGLALGFEQQSDVSGTWQRSVVLISASAPSANRTDEEIVKEVEDLRYGPQNPISIFSFAASFSFASPDLVGKLATSAGGELFVLTDKDDIDMSGKEFVDTLIQSSVEDLKLEIRPRGLGGLGEIVGNAASISDDGLPVVVKIPGLFPGEQRSFNVSLDISLLNTSSVVLSVVGEYFDRALFKSVSLEPQLLTITVVKEQVLHERNRVRRDAAIGLSNAKDHLVAGNVSMAETSLVNAKNSMAYARYQDDPVISATRKEITSVLNSIQGEPTNGTLDTVEKLLSGLEGEGNSAGIEPFVKKVGTPISGVSQAARNRLLSLENSGMPPNANLLLLAACIFGLVWVV